MHYQPYWEIEWAICNFIEIALRHGCSLVTLLHICWKIFRKNTSGGLLLSFESCMDMNGVNPFICSYDIRAVFGSILNVSIFTFLHTNFVRDFTEYLFWNHRPFKVATLHWHGFIVADYVRKNFAEGKKFNSFSNFFNRFFLKLTLWVKISSIL